MFFCKKEGKVRERQGREMKQGLSPPRRDAFADAQRKGYQTGATWVLEENNQELEG